MSNKKYAQDGKRIFVKYANRKLYDTQESKYATLGEIAKLPSGSFVVIDQVTKEDITSETLLSALTSYFQENPAAFETVREELVNKFFNN